MVNEIYQGDSSDIYAVTVTRAGAQVIGSDLNSFQGSLVLKKKLSDNPIAGPISMTLHSASNTFRGQFAPADTESLDPGIYQVILEIKTNDASYKKEYRSTLKILQQGYPT